MKLEYHVIQDGWIKIDAAGWYLNDPTKKSERLLLGLNQLLVRIDGKNILIDTGLGEKWTATELGLLDFQQPRGLIAELQKFGCKPENIDVVILTHLHYDHSGGNTHKQGLNLAPTFTNALYYVQKREYEIAQYPPDELIADYKYFHDVLPVEKSGQLKIIDGDAEIMTGVKVFLAPGHSKGHQVVLIESAKESVFFSGDLFSTREHCNLNSLTAYDFEPKILQQNRKIWVECARSKKWKVVYCHAIRDQIEVLH